jgi:DNA-binding transcriptional MerR regulator
MKSGDRLKIGEVAALLGITTRTIRYYEEVGLLDRSDQTKMTLRTYSTKEVDMLKFILQLKNLGLSLGEICEAVKCCPFFIPIDNKFVPDKIDHFDKLIEKIDHKINAISSLRNDVVMYRRKVTSL